MSLNGSIVTLSAGEYRATLAASGASLASLTYAGRDLVLPFDAASDLGLGYLGRTLAPWPNRISDASYSFDGETYSVPCNEPTTGAALHGLVSWVNWTVAGRSDDSVTFALDLPGSPGYPFPLELRAVYRLDADLGLVAHLGATNIGAVDAPVGLSTHPYLTCGVPVDECSFELRADEVLLTDERMRPAGLASVGEAGFDFGRPTSLSGRRVDHAFTGLPEGQSAGGNLCLDWEAVLAHPDLGAVALASDAPWVQAFTGDVPGLDRGGVAVEPMTCPPDAFNSHLDDVRLAPGDVRVLTYSIRAL